MVTIVEPKQQIEKLWGKQCVKEDETYRLMRYTLHMVYEGKEVLYNVVTGQLVALDQVEADLFGKLPIPYTPEMDPLISSHYLVPSGYDEHQQVQNLRAILRRLDEAQNPSSAITSYTILPTTACNARCYYCFEQGIEPVTMSEAVADDVVRFISLNCGNTKPVRIIWFGGEPTVASSRIDQICEGLQRNGVDYYSSITTNGYLLDEALTRRAKELWHLNYAMICVDGFEKNYNKTKAYKNATESPYQVLMRNIGFLLAQGIWVNLRLNFDLYNAADFDTLINDIIVRFKRNPLMEFHVHPINGVHMDHEGMISHASNEWFEEKIAEFNRKIRDAGLERNAPWLPSIRFRGCRATSKSAVVINAQGNLVRCSELFGDDQITGNVRKGITNVELLQEWNKFVDFPKCVNCELYPHCVKISNCPAGDLCYTKPDMIQRYHLAMINALSEN